MAPTVDSNVAVFYQKTNYEGSDYSYPLGSDVDLSGPLNDKYLSVAVGASVKVIAWQHYDATGRYREWAESQSDISDIGGLTRFRVVDDDTRAISFLFKDSTGGQPRQYSLKVDAKDVGSVTLYSNATDEYALVGVMPAGGPPVTTAVYVRDEKSGGYIALGSVYFQWNGSTNEVDVVENDNWPKQLDAKRTGKSSFEVTLIDNKPSE